MNHQSINIRSLLCVLYVLCAFIAVSCSHDPKSALVGTWKEDSSGETIQFFAEGTVSIKSKMGPLGGSYSVIDATHVRFDLGGVGALAGPVVATFEVSSNTLKLTGPDGKLSTYKRVS